MEEGWQEYRDETWKRGAQRAEESCGKGMPEVQEVCCGRGFQGVQR